MRGIREAENKMTTKYIEIDRAIETALLLLEEGEDEQTLAYNAALVAFIKNMENVPAADVPRWIPVTERLPKKYGKYLVSVYFNSCVGGELLWYGQINGKDAFYYGDTEWDEVIAWMPLPTPYKGGEEE